MWDRMWLYVRLIALVLIIILVVQMFIANVAREGTGKPAVTFAGTETFGGVWTLIVVFVLGVFSTPLYRASIKTWKEFKVERARQKDEQAEKAVQQKLGSILELTEAQKAAQAAESPAPPVPGTAPPAGDSAADIWTSGEQDT